MLQTFESSVTMLLGCGALWKLESVRSGDVTLGIFKKNLVKVFFALSKKGYTVTEITLHNKTNLLMIIITVFFCLHQIQ